MWWSVQVHVKGECTRTSIDPWKSIFYLLFQVGILRSKAVVAIFVVRASQVGCVFMYRPIGTPATPSGLYFWCIFLEIFSFSWISYRTLCCIAIVTAKLRSSRSIHFGPDSFISIFFTGCTFTISAARNAYVGCDIEEVCREFLIGVSYGMRKKDDSDTTGDTWR